MEFIKNVIRGITIGIANVVPGVSGGTIMVSLGIYDELLQAVTGFFVIKREKHLKSCFRICLEWGSELSAFPL